MSSHDADDDDYGREDDEMFARRDRSASDRDRDRARQRPGVVTDFVRRAIENTVGSVQNTGSVSREAITYLLQQGDRGRREIVRIVAKEAGDFLRATDLSSEIIKVLTGVQMEVSASVRFKRNHDGTSVRPEVSDLSVTDADGNDLLKDFQRAADEERDRQEAPEDEEPAP